MSVRVYICVSVYFCVYVHVYMCVPLRVHVKKHIDKVGGKVVLERKSKNLFN